MRRRLLLILAAVVLLVLGTGIAVLLTRHPPGGTLETNVTDGLLGTFKIDENGDPEEASGAVVGFTVYVATDELTTETTVSPKPETVAAAGGKS